MVVFGDPSVGFLVGRGFIIRNGVGGRGAILPRTVWEPFSEWPTIRSKGRLLFSERRSQGRLRMPNRGAP